MELLRTLDPLPAPLRGGAVAIGNFDGVHAGHGRIVARLRQMAQRLGGAAVVFTFDPLPAHVLRPQTAPTPLTWIERRAELLGQLGVDAVVACPTDRPFLELSPREFFDGIVRERLHAGGLVEGPDFFFGARRQGDIHLLKQYGDEAGIAVEIVPPLAAGGETVSSSRIRRLLAEGRLDEANELLARPYRIRGRVAHGAGRGRTLGYPTANVAEIDTLLPGEGIYAGLARVPHGWLPAAISIGPNPTFGEGRLKVEVYVLDFSGDLYGQPLEVAFLRRLRDVVRYASVEELVRQLADDVAATRRLADRAAAT